MEGFWIILVDEFDFYNWEVVIFGFFNIFYEGGYFKVYIKFFIDYFYLLFIFRFLIKMWYFNIYENGDVCILIFYLFVDDL